MLPLKEFGSASFYDGVRQTDPTVREPQPKYQPSDNSSSYSLHRTCQEMPNGRTLDVRIGVSKEDSSAEQTQAKKPE